MRALRITLYFLLFSTLFGCTKASDVDSLFLDSAGRDVFGEIGNSAIEITPASVDFGPVPVNTSSSSRLVSIRNTASVGIYVSSIFATSSYFSIISEDCTLNNQSLAPGESCQMRVVFNPTLAGELSSTLAVRFGATIGATDYVSYSGVSGISTTDLVFAGVSSVDTIRSTSVRLLWTDVANENGYAFFRVNGAVLEFLGTAPRDSSSVVVTGLLPSTSYNFRVRAIDFYGNYDANTIDQPVTTSPPVSLSALNDYTYLQPSGPLVPLQTTVFDVNNQLTMNDDGMAYQCFYDELIDGNVASTLPCSSLSQIVLDPSFASSGQLDFTPVDEDIGFSYEIRITGSDGGTTDDEIIGINVTSAYVRNANLVLDYQAAFSSGFRPGQNLPFDFTFLNLVIGGSSLDGDLNSGTWNSGWAGDNSNINNRYRLIFEGNSGAGADRVIAGTDLNTLATPLFTTWIRPTNLTAGASRVFGNGGEGDDGWSLVQLSSGQFSFSVGNGGGDSKSALLDLNPTIYLDLDETGGGPAINSGSLIQNANFVNGASITQGISGAYGGSSAYRTVSNAYLQFSPQVDISTTWTMMAWILFPINHHASWKTLVRGSAYHPIIFSDTTNELGSYVGSMRSSGFDADTLSPGWHHIAAIANGGTTTFYVDGNQVGVPINFVADDSIVAVGNYQSGPQSIGTFDDFAYFSSALSPAAINDVYLGSCSTTLDENAWSHLGGFFDGVSTHLYKNGSLVCSRPLSGNVLGSMEQFSVGAKEDGSMAWEGEIASLQIYDSGSSADVMTNFVADALRYSYPASCSHWLPLGGTSNGLYFIEHPTLGLKQVYCDQVTDGGGWMMVANYVHQGGTNPTTTVRASDLPLLGSNNLGDTEAAHPTYWGHASNSLMNNFTYTEARLYCRTSAHARIVDFKTTNASCLNSFKTGTGTCSGVSVGYTVLPGHTGNMPANVNAGFSNQGNNTMTEFPFYRGGTSHWGIRGAGTRWECDDFPGGSGSSTIHRIFVR